jgi:mannose-6-phosphate isomerase-like protein (cupin superfamily)
MTVLLAGHATSGYRSVGEAAAVSKPPRRSARHSMAWKQEWSRRTPSCRCQAKGVVLGDAEDALCAGSRTGCLIAGALPARDLAAALGAPDQRPARAHRIATVPFTLRNLKEDLEDVGFRFDGPPDLEFRLATEALELEQSGLSYQRVPPGYRFPYGHTHRKQEEVYVVLRGSGRMKLDDEIVKLKEWDAVRVPPRTWRGYEAGPEGLEIIVIGAPNLGEAPREDVEGQRDWWAD